MTTMNKEKRYPLKNMAFKCTYNDGGVEENGIGFTKTCSDTLIQQHIKAKRAWCSNSGCPCRNYYDGKISRNEREEGYDSGMHVCYERKMLIEWKAQAGTHRPNEYTEGIRLKIRNANTNSLAILTTRPPGYSEKDRIIFAVFIIDDFYDGDDSITGYVCSHSKYRMMFTLEEGRKLLFWKYHANKNSPSKPLWGTGLFRYVAEDEGVQILRDAAKLKIGTKDEQLAGEMLRYYCQQNHLDSERIGDPEGALTRNKQ